MPDAKSRERAALSSSEVKYQDKLDHFYKFRKGRIGLKCKQTNLTVLLSRGRLRISGLDKELDPRFLDYPLFYLKRGIYS